MSGFDPSKCVELVSDFERRHGYALPRRFADALGQNHQITFVHRLFHGKVHLGPIIRKSGPAGTRLEDYGYRFDAVDNYMGFREDHCFVIDPFQSGDDIFLIGKDGQFGPALMFADHETGDIIELFPDVEAGVHYEN